MVLISSGCGRTRVTGGIFDDDDRVRSAPMERVGRSRVEFCARNESRRPPF